ncbi:hypothetical protein Tco_0984855 [Tanacetum coccineum]
MDLVYRFLGGVIDSTKYEDDCRTILGTWSFLVFTLKDMAERLPHGSYDFESIRYASDLDQNGHDANVNGDDKSVSNGSLSPTKKLKRISKAEEPMWHNSRSLESKISFFFINGHFGIQIRSTSSLMNTIDTVMDPSLCQGALGEIMTDEVIVLLGGQLVPIGEADQALCSNSKDIETFIECSASNLAQIKCFTRPLQSSEIVDVKRIMPERVLEGVNKYGITLVEFLSLHALMIGKDRAPTT